MEGVVKQMRVRFSGLGQDSQEGTNNSREKRLPARRTQSFKGERKKAQNWIQRQFSGQMNQEYESSDGDEFATVAAAVAFAVNSIEEAGLQNQKKMSEVPETPWTKSKIRKEDSKVGLPDPGRVSRRFSGKEAKEDKQSLGETSMKKSEVTDQGRPEGAAIDRKMPEKAAGVVPTIKRTPTFADAYLNGTGTTKPGTTLDTRPRPGGPETVADAWEKTELARIEKRYEKMNSTILSWESGKRAKARRRMDRIESELERRRLRASQHYRSEISRIDEIAGGARKLAEERRIHSESKAKEKAKKIRSTGKAPVTCFCF